MAASPAMAGKGLGMTVSAAAVNRMLAAGYRVIHLYTEIWRYAAIKTYLRLGFIPYLDLPNSLDQWQAICAQVGWSISPHSWREVKLHLNLPSNSS